MIRRQWFKIELYTATPSEFTDYILAKIQKISNISKYGEGSLSVSNQFKTSGYIDMDEGTTRYVNVDCKNQDGSIFNLTGYDVTILLFLDGSESIVKTYTIIDNTISFTVDPVDTIGHKSAKYEIRIYKNNEIYNVIKGDMRIHSSIRPFLNANEEV